MITAGKITRTAALLGALVAGAADAQPAEGYVLAVQGTWTTPGRTLPLAVGVALPAAARVVARQAAAGDRIVIVAARTGAVLLSRECGEPRACRDPFVVPAAPAAASTTWAESLRRVMGRLEGAPDRYVATLSRNDAGLPDAVLALDESRVDLAPVFGALPAGRYELSLHRLDCADTNACTDAVATMDWAGGQAAAVVAAPGAGLVDLRVRVAGAETGLTTRRARLLLVPAAAAAIQIERYRAWLAFTERWGAEVDAGSRKRLLRAAMDELAASP